MAGSPVIFHKLTHDGVMLTGLYITIAIGCAILGFILMYMSSLEPAKKQGPTDAPKAAQTK